MPAMRQLLGKADLAITIIPQAQVPSQQNLAGDGEPIIVLDVHLPSGDLHQPDHGPLGARERLWRRSASSRVSHMIMMVRIRPQALIITML
jgi:hypothetical protein